MLPISLRDANAFVLAHHRHSGQVRGCKFCVAVVDDLDAVHGVAIVGPFMELRLWGAPLPADWMMGKQRK